MITDRGVAKIGDFGLARPYGSPEKALTSNVVTMWYRAPELFFGSRAYSDAVDIWSFGCIVAEMTQSRPLFPGESEFDMLTKIFTLTGTPTKESWPYANQLPNFVEFTEYPGKPMPELIKDAPPGIIEFLKKILKADPNQRPKAEVLLGDIWFKASPTPCAPGDLPFVKKK